MDFPRHPLNVGDIHDTLLFKDFDSYLGVDKAEIRIIYGKFTVSFQ